MKGGKNLEHWRGDEVECEKCARRGPRVVPRVKVGPHNFIHKIEKYVRANLPTTEIRATIDRGLDTGLTYLKHPLG